MQSAAEGCGFNTLEMPDAGREYVHRGQPQNLQHDGETKARYCPQTISAVTLLEKLPLFHLPSPVIPLLETWEGLAEKRHHGYNRRSYTSTEVSDGPNVILAPSFGRYWLIPRAGRKAGESSKKPGNPVAGNFLLGR